MWYHRRTGSYAKTYATKLGLHTASKRDNTMLYVAVTDTSTIHILLCQLDYLSWPHVWHEVLERSVFATWHCVHSQYPAIASISADDTWCPDTTASGGTVLLPPTQEQQKYGVSLKTWKPFFWLHIHQHLMAGGTNAVWSYSKNSRIRTWKTKSICTLLCRLWIGLEA